MRGSAPHRADTAAGSGRRVTAGCVPRAPDAPSSEQLLVGAEGAQRAEQRSHTATRCLTWSLFVPDPRGNGGPFPRKALPRRLHSAARPRESRFIALARPGVPSETRCSPAAAPCHPQTLRLPGAGRGVEASPGQGDASEDGRTKWPDLRSVNSAGCLRSSVATWF